MNSELTKIKRQYHLEMVQSRKLKQSLENIEKKLGYQSSKNTKLISLNKIYQSKWDRVQKAVYMYSSFYKKNFEWMSELYEDLLKRGIISLNPGERQHEYTIDSPEKFLRKICREKKLQIRRQKSHEERKSSFLEYQDEILNEEEDSQIPSEEESNISCRMKSEKEQYIQYMKKLAMELQDRFDRLGSGQSSEGLENVKKEKNI
jgi:hypothetical protein